MDRLRRVVVLRGREVIARRRLDCMEVRAANGERLRREIADRCQVELLQEAEALGGRQPRHRETMQHPDEQTPQLGDLNEAREGSR